MAEGSALHDKSLQATEIEADVAKQGGLLGRKVFALDCVTSTNEVARKLGKEGYPEGTLVIAEEQSSGKGRYERSWFSPPHKGLWFSMILRPQTQHDKISFLTLLAGLAIANAVEQTLQLAPSIKWPNDLLFDGQKFCGVVAEGQSVGNSVAFIVLGIGINVNQKMGDFPEELQPTATSLRIKAGRPVGRAALLSCILSSFEELYSNFNKGNHAEAVRAWEKRCPWVAKRAQIHIDNRVIEGVFEGIDRLGRARLRLVNGELAVLTAGELGTA